MIKMIRNRWKLKLLKTLYIIILILFTATHLYFTSCSIYDKNSIILKNVQKFFKKFEEFVKDNINNLEIDDNVLSLLSNSNNLDIEKLADFYIGMLLRKITFSVFSKYRTFSLIINKAYDHLLKLKFNNDDNEMKEFIENQYTKENIQKFSKNPYKIFFREYEYSNLIHQLIAYRS
ncbi:hypothetical protein A0H76_918 [Hepatospora eriocheir]|uniref:Uncharacterized protein n=1 Tax=Hepatospora eriocheir TaxID=1081669 RepID=A0A1X0QB91_9MICR|nr:hypothetical protein HERIO_1064 [Hepatospora eriocheir]ORD99399.1 hypothetical protein A0H76_918 [Hepatospora eriocheir]